MRGLSFVWVSTPSTVLVLPCFHRIQDEDDVIAVLEQPLEEPVVDLEMVPPIPDVEVGSTPMVYSHEPAPELAMDDEIAGEHGESDVREEFAE